MEELMARAQLTPDHVVVERVRIGRVVDAVPPIRHEGGITVLPVTGGRAGMVLREEIHFRRLQSLEHPNEQPSLGDTE